MWITLSFKVLVFEQLFSVETWSPGSSPCNNTCTSTKFSTAKVNLDTDTKFSNPTRSKFNDGMSDTAGELGHDHGSTNSRGNTPHESDRMRPFVSQGDPSQFIVIGSIGNQRVRILVDTGATISFISSTLVPTLTPKPEVKKSELSVVLGNNETQDTDHYVDVPLTIHNCSLPARLLLATPRPHAGVAANRLLVALRVATAPVFPVRLRSCGAAEQ